MICDTKTPKAATPAPIAADSGVIDVFDEIARALVCKGKRVIGISGVDTSGKTMFADRLSRYLTTLGVKSEILHVDDFHNPCALRRHGDNEREAYWHNAFNYRQIADEILEPLRANGKVDAKVLCLNLDTDKYENLRHYRVDGETILLIEGVLLFRPPLDDYFDGRIFLNIDFDEVMRRVKVRDVPKYGVAILDKYREKYIPVQMRYLNECAPDKSCDILVDNTDWCNPRLLSPA